MRPKLGSELFKQAREVYDRVTSGERANGIVDAFRKGLSATGEAPGIDAAASLLF